MGRQLAPAEESPPAPPTPILAAGGDDFPAPLIAFSLFGGSHTAVRAMGQIMEQKPRALIVAEENPEIRRYISQRYRLSEKSPMTLYQRNDEQIVVYPRDVWDLFLDHGSMIKQVLRAVGAPPKIAILGGSPCQQLTTVTKNGLLGFTGQASKHFMVIPALLYALKQWSPDSPSWWQWRMPDP